MRDVIDCPTCGGQLIKAGELEDVYTCDVCGHRLENGMHHAPKEAESSTKPGLKNRLRTLIQSMRDNATALKNPKGFAHADLQPERNSSAYSMEFWAKRIEEELAVADTPIDPDGPARRESQMRINFNFLLQHIDAIHAALCAGQQHWHYRTWQQRAEMAMKTAQEIAAERKRKNEQ